MTTHDRAAPARPPLKSAGAAPLSPFYDHQFANNNKPDPNPWHISGACQAAYARGCRCNDCRTAWREGSRRRNGAKPAPLAREVDRLNTELDAMELNLAALREENAMLRCRLDELGEP